MIGAIPFRRIAEQGRNDNPLLQASFHARASLLLVLLPGTSVHAHAQDYFQQRVDYIIDVRLDDRTNDLFATETFTYTNNAPRALDTLWMHLWPNAYKDRGTALCEQLDQGGRFALHFAKEKERGWIDSLDFRSGDSTLRWGFHPEHIDIAWVRLPQPLATGEQVTITTPFHVRVPSARFSRLGHLGDAFYITQWYPKPAVYDEWDCWHAMPYLAQGEFYSEFGSFDVRITLPANYVVGATGEQQSAAEAAFMDSLAALPPSFLLSGGGSAFPPSSERMKMVRFTQDNVHDFAWFADKRFQVRKGSVTLPRSGRTVTTWTLCTPQNAATWSDAITYVNESVRLYSEWVGDYPYSACTAIDGTSAEGGGMEYPMITIINDSSEPFELDVVIAHEVGHNWFYGILGSNERDHPWMDEGINSFYEQRYVETRYPGKRFMDLQGIPLGFLTRGKGITYRQQNELQYRFNARRNWDSPPDSPSAEFGELDYGTTVYSKTALAFDNLRTLLGEAAYDSCMHGYFDAWKFKHPRPEDLEHSFGMDEQPELATTFREAIRTAGKTDRRPKRGAPGMVPEIDPRNDRTGVRLPEFRFLAGLEREDRRSIYWTPAIGYNTHDGWMPGITLRNTTFPSQRFEWVLAPLYGTQSGRLAGGGRFVWNHDRLRSSWLRNIHVGVLGFAASLWNVDAVEQWYQRVVPSIQFDLRSKPGAVQTDVRYRGVLLWKHEQGDVVQDNMTHNVDAVQEDVFHEVSLHHEQANGLFPFDLRLTSLNHAAFNRLALDATWSAIYDKRKHRVTLRGFGGYFLDKRPGQMTSTMGWRMYWGSSDLLYDNLFIDRQYPGRNTAQQMVKTQGGFKTPTAYGTSDTWIAALNLEADFPFRLPLSVFASYGAAPYTIVDQDGKRTDWQGYWEAGIGVKLVRDVVELWIPLAYSKEVKDEVENFRGFDFGERIRFVLALENLDPTQLLRKAPH